MNVFDLHCDTATELYHKSLPFDNSVTHINLRSLQGFEATLCFAVFFDDRKPNPNSAEFFQAVADRVDALKHPGLTPILTAEGAGALAYRADWIDLLCQRSCRMASLVWNGRNPLATGAVTDDRAPLTDAGRAAVRELIRRGVTVDVSHLSGAGTDEILHRTDAPIVASHSNARALCDHPRNLTDDRAREIFRRGGLIGLNLCPYFLTDGRASTEDVCRHAEHFLKLGGEKGLSLGCDWDGAPLPEDMKDFSSLRDLAKVFETAFGKELTERIFYRNASRFFTSP